MGSRFWTVNKGNKGPIPLGGRYLVILDSVGVRIVRSEVDVGRGRRQMRSVSLREKREGVRGGGRCPGNVDGIGVGPFEKGGEKRIRMRRSRESRVEF